MILFRFAALFTVVSLAGPLFGQTPNADTARGDELLASYFESETAKLRDDCLAEIGPPERWLEKRKLYRQQLREMLGLEPLPEKTDLEVQFTNEVEHDDFVVKCLHFQSRPGLYVTANLYEPKNIERPLPAILYVCGHGRVRIDGVDYGNKVHYQHHGAWFARNGYICLTIDTLQLGEIEGIHHGTYREGMWWWLNRGYTPAGVEAWNCVRALDLLQSLDEVDGDRLGVTGRSGGGAYSWWLAALDERIKCAVPVAGITDLENHVVDGCVEGHCDCMYMVNTYRWDYPMLAALVAPRPLLISNTDSDGIFPLDGVYRTYQKVKRVYEALGAKENVALHITAGPHQDTQELRVHAFRWMNKHLKDDAESTVLPAEKYFEPIQLKVFDSIPDDQQNQEIQEHFVEVATPTLPESSQAWEQQKQEWMTALEEKVFRGWPRQHVELRSCEQFEASADGLMLRKIEFTSQEHVRLPLLLAYASDAAPEAVELHVLDDTDWGELMSDLAPAFGHRLGADLSARDELGFQQWAQLLRKSNSIHAYLAPRGVGPTAWDQSDRKQIQNQRRFYLLGQTRDGMRVYDTRRAVHVMREEPISRGLPVSIHGKGVMAGVGLYAALFEPGVAKLQLDALPQTHRNGPILLNVRRFFDLHQAVAMAISSQEVTITQSGDKFDFATHVARLINRSSSLRLVNDN